MAVKFLNSFGTYMYCTLRNTSLITITYNSENSAVGFAKFTSPHFYTGVMYNRLMGTC